MEDVASLQIVDKRLRALVDAALEDNDGLLRLAPCWVPRSFLVPGNRLRLHPGDLYAFGLNRGGIDERWFSSTIPAMNEGRVPDEGFSYCVYRNTRFTLANAIEECGAHIVGNEIWEKYGRWPVYAKLFDNLGPIPLHMHQSQEHAKLVGQEGKPEAYFFPPQYNTSPNRFPYTFFGLEPGTTKDQVKLCLERWEKGDNGILDVSKAYRLKTGTGWLVHPGFLHAPGSLCTYEAQWGSDVASMFQSLVEGREIPRSFLVKDMPPERHNDLDFIVSELAWEANVDPEIKRNHYLEPIAVAGTGSEGYLDRWVIYGKIQGKQLFTAKELTIQPGIRCTIRDKGAYGLIVVQGSGKINKATVSSPTLIRFNELTEDELFCTESAARAGVVFENVSSTEALVILRYFGPDINPDAPEVGASLSVNH
jgi:hypothetical protein